MAGFDDLIRGALEKQGDPSAERREVIYNSSRQALERMLSQNTSLDAEAAGVQRKRLEDSIISIEDDYLARDAKIGAAAASPQAPSLDPDPEPVPAPVRPPEVKHSAPSVAPAPEMAVRAQPSRTNVPKPQPVAPPPEPPMTRESVQVPVEAGDINNEGEPKRIEDFTGEYRDDLKGERKPYAKLLLWTIVLVGVAVGIWWAITFGPELLKQKLDGSVPNPARSIESGAFLPNEEDGWRNVFVPSENGSNIDSAGRGKADIFVEGETSFVRLASQAGSTSNTIRIKLPKGILFAIRGKAATFELLMKGSTNETHQFAVFCDFGAMGECGRKRFTISTKIEAFIFDVLVNDTVLAAGEDAYVSINTDLSSAGRNVDLYAIRVRPEE